MIQVHITLSYILTQYQLHTSPTLVIQVHITLSYILTHASHTLVIQLHITLSYILTHTSHVSALYFLLHCFINHTHRYILVPPIFTHAQAIDTHLTVSLSVCRLSLSLFLSLFIQLRKHTCACTSYFLFFPYSAIIQT